MKVILSERPGRDPGLHAAGMSTVAQRPAAVKGVAAVGDAVELGVSGAAGVPAHVQAVTLADAPLALAFWWLRAFVFEAGQTAARAAAAGAAAESGGPRGAALPSTLDQAAPVAAVKGVAAVGDAGADAVGSVASTPR